MYQILLPSNTSPLSINIHLKNGHIITFGIASKSKPLSKLQVKTIARNYSTYIIMPWKTWERSKYYI